MDASRVESRAPLQSGVPGLRALLASPDYLRLWSLGGLINAMRFLETLVAALFTLDAGGSALAVAAVLAARPLPMLCFGPIAGVIAESLDRRLVLSIGLACSACVSALIAVLAVAGLLLPWHLGLAAFAAGTVQASEMATRRRMVGEVAGSGLVARAIALDSMTGAITRAVGPVLGGLAYVSIGVGGAYAASAVLVGFAALLAQGVTPTQAVRRLAIGRVPRDLAEGFATARALPVVMAVLGTTIAMNTFGFSYSALVAPIGREVFGASPALVGVLAACEPTGALIGGLLLAAFPRMLPARMIFLGGSALFLVLVIAMGAAPGFWVACALLTFGGIGTAGFGNQQTVLVLTEAPSAMRSRLLGLITACIGCGPLGQLAVGALAGGLGPMLAVQAMAAVGLVLLAVIDARWRWAERREKPPAG